MKVLKKIVPYKIRRLLPIAGIAAMGMALPSCDKDDEPDLPPYDVEIVFYEDFDVTFDILRKLAIIIFDILRLQMMAVGYFWA